MAFESCGKRKIHSSTLYNTIQNTMEKVWLACVQRYLLNLSIIQENVVSSVSAEKKSDLSFIEKKKNSDCADITKIKDEKIV